jgi:hypothetical protein
VPIADERDVLRLGLPAPTDKAEITSHMVEAVRQRIVDAGGILTVWAVLHEDVYESEFGDGFYLHLCGIALNSGDAERLAAFGGNSRFTRWHVRSYRLSLKDEAPAFHATWRVEEEFTINDLVEILCEIPAGRTVSKLLTGSGIHGRRPGPHMLELA